MPPAWAVFYWLFPMPPITAIPAEAKQRAYDFYLHHPSVSLAAIAAFLGVSRTWFFRLRKAWNWPPRREALQQGGEGRAPAGPGGPSATLREAALSLAQVTRARIDALVKEQHAAGEAVDHDRTARTLAAYAKTLTTAQVLLAQEGTRLDDDERSERPTRTIHELRDELARHLERVVAEEEARGRDGLLV